MNNKPHECQGCQLYHRGKGFADVEGDGSSGLLVCAEALGEKEAQHSLPLRPFAQSGMIFSRSLHNERIDRSKLTIVNIVNCQPPGNKLEGSEWEVDAISNCRRHLTPRIRKANPKAILALGNVALSSLTNLKGKKKDIGTLRGYVLWSNEFQLPVIPTYHPSFIARGNKNLIGIFNQDIRLAYDVATGRAKEGERYTTDPIREYRHNYHLLPRVDDFSRLVNMAISDPSNIIAYDIETSDSIKTEDEEEIILSSDKITQFQFSTGKRHAVVIPWHSDYLPHILRLMSSSNRKLSWNGWRFDDLILEQAGIHINGESWDLMTTFHFYEPDLPCGLQYAASIFQFPYAWKHFAGDNLPFYGAADVDSLHWIYEPLVDKMRKEKVLGIM